MSRKRLFLFAVVVACAAVLVYAVAQPRSRSGPREGWEHKEFGQEAQGVSLKGFSDSGDLEWVARGERAVMKKTNLYQFFKLSLEIPAGLNPSTGQPRVLRLTSETGDIHQSKRRAVLREKVVLRVDQNTTMHTPSLEYRSSQNLMRTEKPVTIVGKGIQIDGTGLVVEIVMERATILRDIVVRLSNIGDDMLGTSTGKATTATPTSVDAQIRCTGKLVMLRETSCASFHEDVEVLRGPLKLSADEMLVFFDGDTKQVRSVVASGNVTIKDKRGTASGAKLAWDAASQIATLFGDPKVSIVMKHMTVSADRAIYYQKESEVVTEGGGYLVYQRPPPVLSGEKDLTSRGKPETVRPIEVVWKGQLVFRAKTDTATFFDQVQITRDGSSLRCNELEVQLETGAEQAKKIEARKDVKIKQGSRVASGSRLIYVCDKDEATLVGEPYAQVRQEDLRIQAGSLRLAQAEQKLSAEGPGRLTQIPRDGKPEAGLTVTWHNGMVLLGKEKKAVFTGNVVARREDSEISGDTLTVGFGKKNELQKLVAKGNTKIQAPEREGRGSSFEWDMQQGTIDLAGEPMATLRQAGCHIACRQFRIRQNDNFLEGIGAGTLTTAPEANRPGAKPEATDVAWDHGMVFDGQKHVSTFSGRVRANRGAAQLRAAVLKLLFDEQNHIQELHADRDVTVGDGRREARGDALRWDYATDIAELTATDLVTIKEKGFEGTSKRARYYGKEGRLEFLSPEKPAPAKPTVAAPSDSGEKQPTDRTTIKLYIDRSKKSQKQ